jgi:fatty-acid peroxygenase
MAHRRVPVLDSTPSLLATGFSWLPSRWRRSGQTAVRARLMGKPAIALRGPDAIPFFYDEHHVRRTGAVPKPVQKTLFGAQDLRIPLARIPTRPRSGFVLANVRPPGL